MSLFLMDQLPNYRRLFVMSTRVLVYDGCCCCGNDTKTTIHFLACTVIPWLFWLRMMGTPSKQGNHLNMQRYQFIGMAAWSGIGRRSRHRSVLSKNVNRYPFFCNSKSFIMMSFVSTTLTKFPFLEGAMEPFCLWKIQSSRLRPLLYLGAKERCPSAGYYITDPDMFNLKH